VLSNFSRYKISKLRARPILKGKWSMLQYPDKFKHYSLHLMLVCSCAMPRTCSQARSIGDRFVYDAVEREDIFQSAPKKPRSSWHQNRIAAATPCSDSFLICRYEFTTLLCRASVETCRNASGTNDADVCANKSSASDVYVRGSWL